MANKRIKGITIKIDGETKGLDKALQDVNKRSRDLSSELREVETALKFNPGNIELLAQKQQILTKQVENTTEKLNTLKKAQEQVEQQYKSGEIGAEQYRAFQREIIQTESKLDRFKKELSTIDDTNAPQNLKKDFQQVSKEADNAKEEIKNVGTELGNMIAGAAAGGGIAGVIEKSFDVSELNTKIDISFEVPEESKKAIKEAINTVSAYGVDAEAALEGVRRQWSLNKDASDETNTAIIKGAGAITAAYSGVDFTELIQEVNEMSREMGISNEEALGLTNRLLEIGFPPEQIDIISEYGGQLKRAGYNAEEIQAIMAAGIDTGTWNIDNLLDGLKEGRIRLAEFGAGIDDATSQMLEGTNISADQLQSWGQSVAKGGEDGKKAMQDVAQALMGISDETKRNQLGVQIFGTMWEDQGTNITETLLNMNDHMTTAKENQDKLNESVKKVDSSPTVEFKKALNDLKTALEPVLGVISDVISKIAEWVQNNPTLAATITAIITVLGILLGIFLAISPIITALSAAAGVLGVSMGAIAAPVLIVIAVITTLIAIGVALWKNWDTVKAKASEIFGNVKNTIVNAFNATKTFITDTWNNIKNFFTTTWDNIKSKSSEVFNGIKDGIVNAFEGVKSKISDIWSGIWSTIKGFINRIIGGINTMIGGLNKLKFSAPDWVPGIGGKSFGINIPKIPKLATGGVVSSPTLAMVGDAGLGNPEIVAPEKILRQIISDVMQGMSGQSSIVIQQMNVREETDIKKIARELYNLQQAQKRGLGYR
ncbi:phage tail tape measure protein [Caldibacillus thermoamylovorans]|uniref:phage tail tape measure protein n=1 Tax=Caldibacillus thermoamylovorans TaxID=35841 RepID=UPI00203D22FA|nr:phage tail tape measure protein [Caldibacillus thermoamylovorans]MCM3053668.1 replication protein [Caldibacillus thermoamylovorans]